MLYEEREKAKVKFTAHQQVVKYGSTNMSPKKKKLK
jgi:hypothetical protein